MMKLWGMALLVGCQAVSVDASIDAMVVAAQRVLDSTQFEKGIARDQRFTVAAKSQDADDESFGVYGEFPFRAIAELLNHEALIGANSFVDFGSGAGRLLLGVAAMRDWDSCTGVEALSGLHAIAHDAIGNAEAAASIKGNSVRSIHGSGMPHDEPAAEAMRDCDLVFMYSTAFPSEDGLRLPALSASLACILRDGCVVVTTDKMLVGDRFEFVALLPLEGSEGERIHAFIWRVSGSPAATFGEAFQRVQDDFMGEDACEDNPEACEALLASLDADGLLGQEDE